MFSHDGRWIFALIVFAVIALKTVQKGGDWFDFLQMGSQYSAARTDFDFAMVFVAAGVLIFGVLFYVVLTSLGTASDSVAQAPMTPPVSIAQHKVLHAAHKSHGHKSH